MLGTVPVAMAILAGCVDVEAQSHLKGDAATDASGISPDEVKQRGLIFRGLLAIF